MLRVLLLEAWQSKIECEAASKLGEAFQSRRVFLGHARRCLRGAFAAKHPAQASAALGVLAGSCWTACRSYPAGYDVSILCPRCGEPDELLRRIWTCPYGDELRKLHAPSGMQRAALAAGATSMLYTRALLQRPGDHAPESPALGGYQFEGLNGASLDEVDCSGYGYTDGSCA